MNCICKCPVINFNHSLCKKLNPAAYLRKPIIVEEVKSVIESVFELKNAGCM